MLFFLSPGSLRGPSTDRHETLPHDRKLIRLGKFSPKIRGCFPPEKNGGPIACKISVDFFTTSDFDREYLRNAAKYRKSERHVISSDSFRVRRKRSGERWSTIYRECHVSLNPLKCTFFGRLYVSGSSKSILMKLFPVDVPQGRGDNAGTIFGRPAPWNLWGRKKVQHSARFLTFDFDCEYLRNGSSWRKSEKPLSTTTHSTLGQKICEFWSTNNRVKMAHIDQPKWTFFVRLHFGH